MKTKDREIELTGDRSLAPHFLLSVNTKFETKFSKLKINFNFLNLSYLLSNIKQEIENN